LIFALLLTEQHKLSFSCSFSFIIITIKHDERNMNILWPE
jgi:hypothetical protein